MHTCSCQSVNKLHDSTTAGQLLCTAADFKHIYIYCIQCRLPDVSDVSEVYNFLYSVFQDPF